MTRLARALTRTPLTLAIPLALAASALLAPSATGAGPAAPDRPAPRARLDHVDSDFERHARLRAADRHRPTERVPIVFAL